MRRSDSSMCNHKQRKKKIDRDRWVLRNDDDRKSIFRLFFCPFTRPTNTLKTGKAMLESLTEKNKHIAIGAALGIFFTLSTTAIVLASTGGSKRFSSNSTHNRSRRRSSIGESIDKFIALPKSEHSSVICDGVAGLIGNTPMMRIKSLSDATGCEILAKAEVTSSFFFYSSTHLAPFCSKIVNFCDSRSP